MEETEKMVLGITAARRGINDDSCIRNPRSTGLCSGEKLI